MKEKNAKIIILMVMFLGIAAVVTLSVWNMRREQSVGEVLLETNELVRGASSSDGRFSGFYYMDVNKTGIFYIDEYKMFYTDYESGQNYVLCDKANCRHTSSSCGAYAADMTGLAAYDGNLYAFIKNEGRNTYDLTRMSVNGQDRKVIASLDIGEYKEGEWYLGENIRFESIYYGYGKAYVPVEYAYIYPEEAGTYGNGLSRIQLLIIDLDSGEKTILAESEGMDVYHSLEFGLISRDKIIVARKENPTALIGRELEQAVESGELDELRDMLEQLPDEQKEDYWQEDMYTFYGEYAVYRMTDMMFSLEIYDVSDRETTVLWSGKCGYSYNENGQIQTWQTPFECLGWYGDGFVTQTNGYAEQNGETVKQVAVKLWNLSGDDTGTLMLEIKNGGLPMMSFGSVGNYILDGGKIIYAEYSDDGQSAQICYYDLKSGESVSLYQDVRDITFRFMGETEDSFVGDMVMGDNHDAYIINKNDYYAGNLDAAELLIKDKQY